MYEIIAKTQSPKLRGIELTYCQGNAFAMTGTGTPELFEDEDSALECARALGIDGRLPSWDKIVRPHASQTVSS